MSYEEPLEISPEDGRMRPSLAVMLIGWRVYFMLFFLVVTVFFGIQMAQLKPDASFEKMIPVAHPYIVNFLANRDDLSGLGNSIRITVQTTEGDVFTEEFQSILRQITDEVFYVRGVDRSGLQSLWTPNVRWQEVTEEGFVGGSVIPDDYDGSARALAQLRTNTLKSGQIGRLVGNNFKSATILAPLTEADPETGEKLDYSTHKFSRARVLRSDWSKKTLVPMTEWVDIYDYLK